MVSIDPATAGTIEPENYPSGPPATPRDIPFHQDPTIDHLLRAVVTLTMELSVTRERLRSLELVLGQGSGSVSGEIDQLTLTPSEDAKRRSDRERLIGAILGPFVNVATP